MENIFKKIAEAKASQGGNHMKDGDYTYLIEKFIMNQGHTGTCFIAELRVLEAKQTESDVEPNPVGSTVGFVANVSKQEAALGNVKAFVLAALGLHDGTPSENVQSILAEAVGEAQPLRGLRIKNTTYRYVNKGRANPANRGNVITLPRFAHVPGQTPESITAARAELDGTQTAPPVAQQTQAPAGPLGGILAGLKK